MSKTFNQLVSAFAMADKIGGTFRMKTAGCGTCALASVACNKHVTLTNLDVAKYMVSHEYTRHDGTTRLGMTKAIGHYGMKSTYYSPAYSGVKFEKLMYGIQKTGFGILLMYGHTGHDEAKNDYWTRHGHYISITQYNPTKGFYVRDSANGRSGWHKLSDFAGDCVAGWVLTDVMPAKKATTTTVKTTTTAKTTKTTKPATVVKTVTATVNTSGTNLNVRNNKGTIIGKLANKAKVAVVQKSATTMTINGKKYTMAKISYNKSTGFVAQKHLKF